MAKRYTSVLGVDVGSQTVKVAEIKLQGRQPVLTALGMAPTPVGAVDHVGLHDPEAVAVAVKQACADAGVTVPDVVASLAGQSAILVRTMEVPNMSEGEMKGHMEWEFSRTNPFTETTVETDFKAYPPVDPAAQNVDVVMAMAARSSVDTMVTMIKRAGKKAAALDVEPLALLRGLSLNYDQAIQGKHVCVVDIGCKTTSISIFKDEKLLMPRQVPIGGEMFTRAIADNLGMGFDEAEQAKRVEAELPANAVAAPAYNPFGAAEPTVQSYNPFADPSDPAPVPAEPAAPVPAMEQTNRFYSAMAQPLDEFVAEIRRSIDYFRSKGGDVDLVLLSGGGAKLRNLDKFLTSALGVNTELFDPMRNVQVSLRKGDPSLAQDHRQDFAVAVGNGLHICY